jgi:hypothetical protein
MCVIINPGLHHDVDLNKVRYVGECSVFWSLFRMIWYYKLEAAVMEGARVLCWEFESGGDVVWELVERGNPVVAVAESLRRGKHPSGVVM